MNQNFSMRSGRYRFAVVVFALLAGAPYAPAESAGARQYDLDAQDAGSGLQLLALQGDFQVFFTSEFVQGLKIHEVRGAYGPADALEIALKGTGLKFRVTADGTYIVEAQTATSAAEVGGSGERAADAVSLARADTPSSSNSDDGVGETASGQSFSSKGEAVKPKIEEIVVTAQKRVERLQDVPVPVTALNARTLFDSNQLRLQDYYTRVPGFTVTPAVRGGNILTVRGVTTGSNSTPVVGVTVDDMPYGSSTGLGGGAIVPDFDPGDLARVEVLRGPQGTLYGANSMGGLVKFVTVDPSTDGAHGRLQAGISTVHNGDEAGYSVRGLVNVPVGETVAIRGSAFHRTDPGYIDNVQTGEQAINSANVSGGRVSALWRPSGAFSLKLSALFQDVEADGLSDVHRLPNLGDLQQSSLPGTGEYSKKAQAYSAVINAGLGGVDLTSISGYSINSFVDSLDAGFQYSGRIPPSLFGVTGAVLVNDTEVKKFSQEIRALVSITEKIDWQVGAFYTDEDAFLTQDISAADPASGAIAGLWSSGIFPTEFSEYAGFTNLTWRITDRFDIQLGGRGSHIRTSSDIQTQGGPRFASTITVPAIESKADVFTYLITPRFKISPEVMIYARLASGYRAGGPNGGAAVALGLVPAAFAPDKTQNYEIGVKGDFLDHRITADLSVYHIDWKNIQTFLIVPVTGQGYTGNAGRAKSQGVELAVGARPLQGLTLAGWAAYGNAVLSEPFPPTSVTAYGLEGDRLPLTPHWSGNVSVEQEFPVFDTGTAFVGAALAYVGNRMGNFTGAATQPRELYPNYTKLDLSVGLRGALWTTNFFVTNLADKRGLLNGGAGAIPPFGFQYIQPRTMGLSVSRTF